MGYPLIKHNHAVFRCMSSRRVLSYLRKETCKYQFLFDYGYYILVYRNNILWLVNAYVSTIRIYQYRQEMHKWNQQADSISHKTKSRRKITQNLEGACQILEQLEHFNTQSRGFETSRHFTIRCHMLYWIGPGYFYSTWFIMPTLRTMNATTDLARIIKPSDLLNINKLRWFASMLPDADTREIETIKLLLTEQHA